MKFLEVNSYLLFITSLFTPDNIAIISGVMSISLSLSGILINIYKIKQTNKNNEKDI